MPPTKWNATRWGAGIVSEAPLKPKSHPKHRTRRKVRTGSLGAFLRGETRAEMIRRFESRGVVFSPLDLALSTPELRKVGRARMEEAQKRGEPKAASLGTASPNRSAASYPCEAITGVQIMPNDKFSPKAPSILDLLNEAESVGVTIGEDELRRFMETGQMSQNIIKFQEALRMAREGLAARKGQTDPHE